MRIAGRLAPLLLLALWACHPAPKVTITVTASHVVVSPMGPVSIAPNATQAFTVAADQPGYTVLTAVGGTCPGGSWAGQTFTTAPIVADCTIGFSAALNTYKVTVSGDPGETISPQAPQTVAYQTAQSFTVTANPGYTVSTDVAGTCPAGSWSQKVYTTGAIIADCSVVFSATTSTYQVTASGDAFVTISPSTPQTVGFGGLPMFTVTPQSGHTLSMTVGGTCPAGAWQGDVYTTGAVTADCSVIFSSILTYQVTPSGDSNETINPSAAQTVNAGSKQAFTVVANTGYALSSTVGGTCPTGLWEGHVYTTAVINADCTVIFSATQLYKVTVSGDNGEAINPTGTLYVAPNGTQALTVRANNGFTLSMTVGGTCPAGSWNGAVYTTGVITANCTVTFSATLNTYQVSASGDSLETILPNATQTVNAFSTQAFTVTPNPGYTVGSMVGGTCPMGSWSANVYKTGPIIADCNVTFTSTLNTYKVTPSGDSHETINPNRVQTVNWGTTQAFTVTSANGYALNNTVGGTCPVGTWTNNVYTTGQIMANCSVSFSATLITYQVTSSGDGGETITPSTAQTVLPGNTQAFTVTANTGYSLSVSVGGTCPAGSWAGSVYTTGMIQGNCSVAFSATLNTYQVTVSGDSHETISPPGPLHVGYGSTQTFSVTPNSGYSVSTTVGGNCPAGTWAGSVYTTGTITANCSVSFTASHNTYQVTPSGDSHETITPNGAQTVVQGATQTFTVAVNNGYTLSNTVGGTCPAGTWSGPVYTTGAITANCTVSFSATQNMYLVAPSGDSNETISPSSAQAVAFGGTQAFTITPNAGYTVSNSVGGTCPAGTWSGTTYTTGAVTTNCTVTFSATLDTYQVTASGDSNETISPSTAQAVSYGATQQYTVSGNTGFTVSTTVGGTCPAGSWSGSTYTTGAITGSCSVTFSASPSTYQVTASGDGWETINPSNTQTVTYNGTQAFTVDGYTGWAVSTTVGGTCPQGTWAADVYTTGHITSACTVSFSASATNCPTGEIDDLTGTCDMPQYTASSGTVADANTSLVWQQTVSASACPSDGGLCTWADAQAYCASLTLGGLTWSLPTIQQLFSIVELQSTAPMNDPTAFPGTPSDHAYWSATASPASVPNAAWTVDFSAGGTNDTAAASSTLYVRCVSSGT